VSVLNVYKLQILSPSIKVQNVIQFVFNGKKLIFTWKEFFASLKTLYKVRTQLTPIHINTCGYIYAFKLYVCQNTRSSPWLIAFVRDNFTLFDCVRRPSMNEKSFQKRLNFMLLVSCLNNSINERSLSCLIQRPELYLISLHMEIVMDISKPQKALNWVPEKLGKDS